MSKVAMRRLDEVGTISRGKSKHRPRNDPKLYGGQYPFVQTADIKNAGLYLYDYEQTYNEDGLAQSKLWEPGTLCITIAANIADTSILGIHACFPDSVMGFIPDASKCDVRYMKYSFDMLQRQMKQISQGATQDNLSWQKLATIRFPIPDLEQQRRIADAIAAYDNLIEKNRRQIALLEEASQRLYKEWFVDLRFPGHDSAELNSGVPSGWKRIKLGEFAPFKRGKVITAKQAKPGTIPVVAGGLEPAYYHAEANTSGPVVTVSGSGANAGFTRLYLCDVWASDCSYADADTNENVLFVYLSAKLLGRGFRHLQRGSAQPHVYPTHINDLDLLVPPREVLDQFNCIVTKQYEAIRVAEQSIEVAREARDRLLPKLMTGEMAV